MELDVTDLEIEALEDGEWIEIPCSEIEEGQTFVAKDSDELSPILRHTATEDARCEGGLWLVEVEDDV